MLWSLACVEIEESTPNCCGCGGAGHTVKEVEVHASSTPRAEAGKGEVGIVEVQLGG